MSDWLYDLTGKTTFLMMSEDRTSLKLMQTLPSSASQVTALLPHTKNEWIILRGGERTIKLLEHKDKIAARVKPV